MTAMPFADEMSQTATPASANLLPLVVPFVDKSEDRPDRQTHDPADYFGIVNKHGDRLVRDIGLTRDEILGPKRSFWSEWLRIKAPWQH